MNILCLVAVTGLLTLLGEGTKLIALLRLEASLERTAFLRMPLIISLFVDTFITWMSVMSLLMGIVFYYLTFLVLMLAHYAYLLLVAQQLGDISHASRALEDNL